MNTENERIKQVRLYFKLNQEDFGKSLEVAKTTISSIETGKSIVSRQVRAAVVRVYHINETWLVEGTGEMFLPQSKRDSIADLLATISNAPEGSYIERFAEALSVLSPEDWKHLAEIAEKMAPVFIQKEDK